MGKKLCLQHLAKDDHSTQGFVANILYHLFLLYHIDVLSVCQELFSCQS